MVILAVCCFLTDDIYYSRRLYQINKFSSKEKNEENVVSDVETPSSTKYNSNKIEFQATEDHRKNENTETSNNDKIKSEELKKEENLTNKSNKDDDEESLFGEGEVEGKESIFKRFCLIVKEPTYIFTCIAITTLLFISTAVIFWASDFAINVIHAEHDQVLEMFVIVSITGPVLGIIIGGAVVQKYAGGYEGKHSITFSVVFAACAFCSALPISFLESLGAYGVMLWSVLFFGGAVIPNIQGIMISSLKPELRAAGNSVSNILQNLIGFLPAPLVYGFIYERTKDSNPKLAMSLTLWYAGVGTLFLIITYYYRNVKNHSYSDSEQEVSIRTFPHFN